MEQESFRNVLNKSIIDVSSEEFGALIDFVQFMKNKTHGEFKAILTTEPKTGRRYMLIQVTDSKKTELTALSIKTV